MALRSILYRRVGSTGDWQLATGDEAGVIVPNLARNATYEIDKFDGQLVTVATEAL